MKFLSKTTDSSILTNGWVYKEQSVNDLKLKTALIIEQKGFCAYSERKLAKTDKTHIEHFDPSLKGKDDYYNYYAVIPWANYMKLGKKYTGSLFFQDIKGFNARIVYESGNYFPIDERDQESEELIEFLGFNEPELHDDRRDHIRRLREYFNENCGGDSNKFLNYLSRHPAELSFPTAIEAEFQIDLTATISQLLK